MVGGEEPAVLACLWILEAFGTVDHLGPVGVGQIAKLANNVVGSGTRLPAIEALRLGESYNIEPKRLRALLLRSTAESWALHNWDMLDDFARHHIETGTPDFLAKDVAAAVEAAQDKGISLPTATTVAATIVRAHVDHEAARRSD